MISCVEENVQSPCCNSCENSEPNARDLAAVRAAEQVAHRPATWYFTIAAIVLAAGFALALTSAGEGWIRTLLGLAALAVTVAALVTLPAGRGERVRMIARMLIGWALVGPGIFLALLIGAVIPGERGWLGTNHAASLAGFALAAAGWMMLAAATRTRLAALRWADLLSQDSEEGRAARAYATSMARGNTADGVTFPLSAVPGIPPAALAITCAALALETALIGWVTPLAIMAIVVNVAIVAFIGRAAVRDSAANPLGR